MESICENRFINAPLYAHNAHLGRKSEIILCKKPADNRNATKYNPQYMGNILA